MDGKNIVYQLQLRTATAQGTLRAAERLLPHIASLGVDIIYLGAINEMDADMREEFWSKRQKQSALGNAKNPYRIKDFFKIDEEYGNAEDLKSFVKTAHDNGLSVLMDLVYMHCGPNAVLIDKGEDFIYRAPDGQPIYNEYNFCRMNYDSPALCEYMWSNMEYFVREFDVDGYRCDVGEGVPLWFWKEGRRRIEAIKPHVTMINEGFSEEPITSGVFDINYGIGSLDSIFSEWRDKFDEKILNVAHRKHCLMCYENHDTANDAYDERMEKKFGRALCDAMLVLTFTSGFVPLIYNGNEIADSVRHSIWGNRFHGKNLCVDWSNALTDCGKQRMEHVRRLAAIYHTHKAIVDGDFHALYNDKGVIAFFRTYQNERVVVVVNLKEESASVCLEKQALDGLCKILSKDAVLIDRENVVLESGGYLVFAN